MRSSEEELHMNFGIKGVPLVEVLREEEYSYFWDRLRHITENRHAELFKGVFICLLLRDFNFF